MRILIHAGETLTQGDALWSAIARAERIRCVLDGDAVAVAAVIAGEEVPLAELGARLWRSPHALGSRLAHAGGASRALFLERERTFARKDIDWLGVTEEICHS